MSDGYRVSTPSLVRLAGTFTGQQKGVQQLGGPVQQSAAAVDTGEAALDAETRTLIDTINTLFGQFGQGLELTGTILTEIAEDYDTSDLDSAEDMNRIAAEDLGVRTDVPQV
ncbi:DUF6317 family protein [Actinophytocola sp.]|uniref:DUF6317 family protein n=1 Tax=Actinophytocola sp. TaxID=1872138 RepID=UPI002ED1750D